MAERRATDHPLAAAISCADRQQVECLLHGGLYSPNDSLTVPIGGRLRSRRPLELALQLPTSSCLHNAAPCRHYECLLAAPDSMLRLLIRLGADINQDNCLINVILFGPAAAQPMFDDNLHVLDQLETQMRAAGLSARQWLAQRCLYTKDEHLLLDAIRSCIENGLQWDPNVARSSTVPLTVIIRAVRCFHQEQRILCVLVNLWLCGFPLAIPDVDLPGLREFQLLPGPLQLKARSLAAEALAFSRPPVTLALQARRCIRRALPLTDFRSAANRLPLPSSLQRFVLFAELL